MAEKFMTVLNNNHSLTHYIYDVFSKPYLYSTRTILLKQDLIYPINKICMNENTSNKKLNKLFIL